MIKTIQLSEEHTGKTTFTYVANEGYLVINWFDGLAGDEGAYQAISIANEDIPQFIEAIQAMTTKPPR